MIILVAILAGYGLWWLLQGRKFLHGIQTVHNELVESMAKVDAKVQDALLRIDVINGVIGNKKGIF